LERDMNRDKVVGTAKDLAGKIQRKAGQAMDDPVMAAKGAAKQVEGKAQKVVGAVKDAVKHDRNEVEPADGTGRTGHTGHYGAP
jgi:uncharacterized protein YjbJ (UPF0337 family)